MTGVQTNSQKAKRQRTCIACGKQEGKGALHRLVRMADGSVAFDATGRVAGRGAYVCCPECLAQASKTGKLARALRCAVSADNGETIAQDLQRFLRDA